MDVLTNLSLKYLGLRFLVRGGRWILGGVGEVDGVEGEDGAEARVDDVGERTRLGRLVGCWAGEVGEGEGGGKGI